MNTTNLTADVTRYSVVDNKLVENTEPETTSYWTERGYIHLGNCAGSAPVVPVLEAARAGEGWFADAGSAPVYVERCSGAPAPCGPDCGCGPNEPWGWGGRNYPKVFVTAEELVRVLNIIDPSWFPS